MQIAPLSFGKIPRRPAVLVLMGVGLLIGVFQNCGRQINRTVASVNPRSPFYDQRVRLDDRSTAGVRTADVKAGEPLSILISNACAQIRCGDPKDQSLTCTLWRPGKHPALKDGIQTFQWTASADRGPEQFEMDLRLNATDDACVIGVARSHRYTMDAVSITDAYANRQYHHAVLKTVAALNKLLSTTPLAPVSIGLVDSGVDARHEDFAGTALSVVNTNMSASCTTICNFHGTFVAGIMVARRNSVGGYGIAPNANLRSFQVGDENGGFATFELVNAVNAATQMNVDVMNLSLAGDGLVDYTLQDALTRAQTAGVTLVVAAGNNSRNIEDAPIYPASFNYDGQITVASASPLAVNDNADPPYATDGSPIALDGYSNFAPHLVHLAAPGRRIFSTAPGNQYTVSSGTSFAAPMVTAAVALAKGYLVARGLATSSSLLKQVILEGSRAEAGLNSAVEGNRYLDLDKLADTLANVVAQMSQYPSRIEFISSDVSGADGAKQLHVKVQVSDANLSSGLTMTVYGDHSDLAETVLGTCQITAARQFCDFSLNYTALLTMPELYFQIKDQTGRVVSDLTVPKASINFGDRATANLAGAIVAVHHIGGKMIVEGWTCLVGFPDKMNVELRLNDPQSAPIATTTTTVQGRGDYYATCASAEINFGFRFLLPDGVVASGGEVFFRGVHPASGRAIDLPVYAYQPGFQDQTPAATRASVYVDNAVADRVPVVNITKRTLDGWQLTVAGSACFARSRKPAAFTIGWLADKPASLLPTFAALADNDPTPRAALAAASAGSIDTIFSIGNPSLPPAANAVSFGKTADFSEISDKYELLSGDSSLTVLKDVLDRPTSKFAVRTVTPSIDLGDGCSLPSGFSETIDLRTYVTNVLVKASVTYDASHWTEAQIRALPDVGKWLQALTAPQPAFADLKPSVRVAVPTLEFISGRYRLPLRSDHDGFFLSYAQSPVPATAAFVTARNSGPDAGLAAPGAWNVNETEGINNPLQATESLWLAPLNVALAASEDLNLKQVYLSDVIVFPEGPAARLHFALSYRSGTAWGQLGQDFIVEFFDPPSGQWYEIPVNPGRGTDLYADLDLPNHPDRTQIRIRANGRNALTLYKLGLLPE